MRRANLDMLGVGLAAGLRRHVVGPVPAQQRVRQRRGQAVLEQSPSRCKQPHKLAALPRARVRVRVMIRFDVRIRLRSRNRLNTWLSYPTNAC